MGLAVTGRRRWPLLVIGASAGVAVWSGWVGLGGMTGFGVVKPLPGIWDGLTIDTAITLPIGVEAYAVYALAVATDPSDLPARVRRYAWASAFGSLLLGTLGQVAYHVMAAHGVERAPWWVTAIVATLPVAVIGAASLLWHLRAAADEAMTGDLAAGAGQPASAGQVTAPPVPAVTGPVTEPVTGEVTREVTGTAERRSPVAVDDLVLPAQAVALDLLRAGQKVNRAELAKGLRARGHACSTDKAQALMPLVRERLEKTA